MSWTWQEVVVAVLVGLAVGIPMGYLRFQISEYGLLRHAANNYRLRRHYTTEGRIEALSRAVRHSRVAMQHPTKCRCCPRTPTSS